MKSCKTASIEATQVMNIPHATVARGAPVGHTARRYILFVTGWSADPVWQPAGVEFVHRLIKRYIRFWRSERFREGVSTNWTGTISRPSDNFGRLGAFR
jgi:hypothetical protein